MARSGADDISTKKPGALIGVLSLVTGLIWIAGASAAAVALVGPDQIAVLPPVQLGAIAAAVLLPAIMIWFSGAAASEGAKARAEAQRLAAATDRLLNPERSAEDSTRQLANAVRSEITTLDRALETTLARLNEVQGKINDQAAAVDDMGQRAKTGATHMILGMDRERADLMKISQDLTSQAQMIGDAISRHTRIIAEAARLAEAEVHAADKALDQKITSFGAAAALINDRTHSLSDAAQASADSSLKLEGALSNALDILAKATSLTDAARQSAEQATLAANNTAGAVRETTARAIDDAKRVADLIRSEAVGVEREADAALTRLKDAADAARDAAIHARTAAEHTRIAARAVPELPPPQQVARRAEPEIYPPHRGAEPDPYAHREPQQPRRDDFGAPPPRTPAPAAGGAWSWRDLMTNVDETQHSEPARTPPPAAAPARHRQPAEDAVARLHQTVSEPRGGNSSAAGDVIEGAGLRVHEVFSASGLERVAQRARSGTQARRRAVMDAAPDAVRRLAEHLSRDARANHEAMEFLRAEGARIAELLGRGRAAMGAESTRAFLLIDAAAG